MTLLPDLLGKGNGKTLRFKTIYADPPWRFANRTGKMAPEHKRLHRYPTMTIGEICALPVREIADEPSHLYLWCPNALLSWGLRVVEAWGFRYKANLVWYKIRKDGGPDGRGVGFYYRNVTELLLFGVRGHLRTLPPGRRAVNIVLAQKREHSRKPDEFYELIEQCSLSPYLELFARHPRQGWVQWGDQIDESGQGNPVAIPRRVIHRLGARTGKECRPETKTRRDLQERAVQVGRRRDLAVKLPRPAPPGAPAEPPDGQGSGG